MKIISDGKSLIINRGKAIECLRKNTLFFGSEEGVEVATTYYTLIETAKLNGLSPMDYLTHVFRQLMEGNKDYESLLLGKLALQTI